MVNVVVSRKRNVKVTTNATAGVIDTTVPVTLKQVPTLISGGVNSLTQLVDVEVIQQTNGATIVYDSSTNMYLIKNLDFAFIAGDLDGGTF